MFHLLRAPYIRISMLSSSIKDVQTIAVCDDLYDTGSYLDELSELHCRNKDAHRQFRCVRVCLLL